MAEIVVGLDGPERERMADLRASGRFFWVDVPLAETTSDDLAAVLGIPPGHLDALMGFGEQHRTSRKFHVDGGYVSFAFSCYVQPHLRAVEVHVLVGADFLLTLHEASLSLPDALSPCLPEGRSEGYAVYAVLDAMVATAYDALNDVERMVDDLAVKSTDLRGGRVRMATLRRISSQLARMRRRVGPQRGVFERIGVELRHIEGLELDEDPYFERIGHQVNRLVSAIDAAADALAILIDLRLNETSYSLTVVATIFLPLTFITGFFGMNFGWMVGEIDTPLSFLLLGVGTPLAGVALIWRLVARQAPVQDDRGISDAAPPRRLLQ
jgi:magnesium transporter